MTALPPVGIADPEFVADSWEKQQVTLEAIRALWRETLDPQGKIKSVDFDDQSSELGCYLGSAFFNASLRLDIVEAYLKNSQLLAQGEILKKQVAVGRRTTGKQSDEEAQHSRHGAFLVGKTGCISRHGQI